MCLGAVFIMRQHSMHLGIKGYSFIVTLLNENYVAVAVCKELSFTLATFMSGGEKYIKLLL